MLKPGDEVDAPALGPGHPITPIDTADGPVDEAFPPMSVTLRLEDDIDISRGDMICRPHNQPHVAQDARGDGLLDGGRHGAGPAQPS